MPEMKESLMKLRDVVLAERSHELARAVDLRYEGEHWKAMYHTGLADGHNGIAKRLTAILEETR